MKTVSAQEFVQRLGNGHAADVIDVRTPAEYRAAHVAAARSVPLDQLDAQAVLADRSGEAAGPTYVLCRSGQRARQAAQKLEGAAGIEPVVVEGGTTACVDCGVEVMRGKSTIALERQVRIAAGTLVATGTLLGALVSPWWLIVPGFVGCGLVFAGVTDTCGMAMMLARMPWNR